MTNLKKLKADLFTYGIRFNKKDFKTLEDQNPFNESRSGLSAGRFIIINNNCFVNIPFWEEFVQYSPFEYKNGNLYKDSKKVNVKITFAPTPNWINQKLPSGNYAGQIIQAHGKANLATMIFGCQLQREDTRCKFCTAPYYRKGTKRNIRDIVESLKVTLKYNPNYSLSINTGTLKTEGRGLEITINYLQAIRESFPNLGVLLEIAPPKNSELLIDLKKVNRSGNLGLMLNLNFWSEAALNIVEPGKNKLIPKKEYFEVWKKCIEIFGRGNVSSCVLCGIESEEYTKKAIDNLTRVGVIPEIIMFRPTIGSDLTKVPIDPDLFFRLSNYARRKIIENKLKPAQVGCINCGGCSLTTMKNSQ